MLPIIRTYTIQFSEVPQLDPDRWEHGPATPSKGPIPINTAFLPQSASFNSTNNSFATIAERGAFNGTQSDQQLLFAKTGPVRAAVEQACVSVSPCARESERAGRLTCPLVKNIRRITRSAITVRVRSPARAHRETWSH